MRIEFLNNQQYEKYFRKVRINGKVGYINMNSFKGSNSDIYKSSSNSNNRPPSKIASGQGFFFLKEPKMFSETIKRYTTGNVRIEFLNNQQYEKYFRKVRINGKVGYINMNSFE